MIKLLFHRKSHYDTETIDDPMTSFFHIRFKSAHIGSLHSLFLLKGLNLKEYPTQESGHTVVTDKLVALALRSIHFSVCSFGVHVFKMEEKRHLVLFRPFAAVRCSQVRNAQGPHKGWIRRTSVRQIKPVFFEFAFCNDLKNIHYTFLPFDIFRKERRKKILHHAWEEVPLGNKGKTSIDVILMKLVTSNGKNYDNSITIKEDLDKNQPVRVW